MSDHPYALEIALIENILKLPATINKDYFYISDLLNNKSTPAIWCENDQWEVWDIVRHSWKRPVTFAEVIEYCKTHGDCDE